MNKLLAQNLIPCSDGTFADPMIGCVSTPASVVSEKTELTDVILSFSQMILGGVVVIATALLIIGAIRYATAMGDEDKSTSAKQMMKWSIVGLIIGLLSTGIVSVILKFLE